MHRKKYWLVNTLFLLFSVLNNKCLSIYFSGSIFSCRRKGICDIQKLPAKLIRRQVDQQNTIYYCCCTYVFVLKYIFYLYFHVQLFQLVNIFIHSLLLITTRISACVLRIILVVSYWSIVNKHVRPIRIAQYSNTFDTLNNTCSLLLVGDI